MRGRGKVLDWLRGAATSVNSFLRDNKVLSKIGDTFIGMVPQQYQAAANLGLQGVKLAGYGRKKGQRRRRMVGHGLRLAGGRYY